MRKLYALTFLVAVLFAACASPKDESGAANNNAVQPADSATAPTGQQPGAQTPVPPNGASTPATPTTVPEAAKVTETPSQPMVGQPVADENAPKLLVPTREIDFGKQPKDIKLARSITVKNTGKTDLEIKSVSPS